MKRKIRVMTVFGTRPEAIKMAPIIKLMQTDERFESVVVPSSQHKEMLRQVTDLFEIQPDYDLNIMKQGQSLSEITVKIIQQLKNILLVEHPDIMLVHGDTTTTLGASLAAFYHSVKVGHVEAGLRTWNKWSPYPEEINRQVTDDISELYFAPTELSRANLLHENHPYRQISVTGNTAIDALRITKGQVTTQIDTLLSNVNFNDHKVILLTMHRRENWGKPTADVAKIVKKIVEEYKDVEFVVPMHLNPKVRAVLIGELGDTARIHLIEPLNVFDFHDLIAKSHFILTDSGGIQEEAPFFHKPILVLREETERPEGIHTGVLKLIGTNPENVYIEITKLLNDQAEYRKMARAKNPYGDGYAANRILDHIADYFEQ